MRQPINIPGRAWWLLLMLWLGSSLAQVTQAADKPLVVFAAASLRTALDQVVASWQQTHATQVLVSYAASSTLARQLQAGAKADLFLSASDKWMEYLVQAGRIAPGSRRLLLGNELVLVAPGASQVRLDALSLASIKQALAGGYLAMADRQVPAGSYGIASLTSLGAWPALETQAAFAANVRAALALVAKGGAPLGIVYRTDAVAAGDEVRVVAEFAQASHPPIHYPLALLQGAAPEAQAFARFLGSATALHLFRAQGFSLPLAAATASTAKPSVPRSSGVWPAVRLSLGVALLAVLLSLPLALWLALLLARRHFVGKALLDALLCLPLVMPPVVTGYLLLLLFGKQGLLGALLAEWGLPLAFHWTGAVLAAAVMGFPFLVRAIRLSVESLDKRLEQVAATLGAAPLRVFFTITLPLLLPGIGSGLVLAFARALGEFGATITFVANIPGVTQTLPLALFSELQTPGPLLRHDTLLLLGLSVGISLAALLAAEALLARMKRRARAWN